MELVVAGMELVAAVELVEAGEVVAVVEAVAELTAEELTVTVGSNRKWWRQMWQQWK